MQMFRFTCSVLLEGEFILQLQKSMLLTDLMHGIYSQDIVAVACCSAFGKGNVPSTNALLA